MLPPLEAFFRPAPDGGRRLWLLHRPAQGVQMRGGVVYAHPWAEEMNKSRRMAALAARALATDGWHVLQADLAGCGDSSGAFSTASWDGWLDDLRQAGTWLQSQVSGPLWFWGLRSGALLCAQLAQSFEGTAHLLFWQPVQSGNVHLQQFLRLKAAGRLADGGGKELIATAKSDLARGHTVEIAGYELAAALASGLAGAVLAPHMVPAGTTRHLVWLETSPSEEPALSPSTEPALAEWRRAGWDVQASALRGPSFWQTTEIEEAPALVNATVAALRRSEQP